MYSLQTLHAVECNESILRLIERTFARMILVPMLTSEAERASAHRHEDQADRRSAGTYDRELSFGDAPDEQSATGP